MLFNACHIVIFELTNHNKRPKHPIFKIENQFHKLVKIVN